MMKVTLISLYPPPGFTHAQRGGVASYTRNLATSLMKTCHVTVFADRVSRSDTEYYDDGVKVCRCWSRGVLYPFQIAKKVSNENPDVVHIQHEIYLFGGIVSAILFPLLLLLLKLTGKPTIVTLHGVIPILDVDASFLKENWIGGNPLMMRIGLTLLMKLTAFLSTSIIVHDEKFSRVLRGQYYCPAYKIHVIHHGIEEKTDLIDKNEAKQILGLGGKNVIIFVGYITGYKNIELLIDSTEFWEVQNWSLVIGGGSHPRLSDDSFYQKYLTDLRERASKISQNRIIFRGFISEKELPIYFSAADLVVFPYKTCMHASGPICLSLSYETPFLVSEAFRDVIQSNEITFINDPKAVAEKINRFFTDPVFRSVIINYVRELRATCLWSIVGDQTYSLYRKSAN